jgi:hypothetical protein
VTLWLLQTRISRHLLLWSALSMLGGALLILFLTPFWRGVGVQSVVWGVIDAGIALFGLYTMRRKRFHPEANTPQVLRREARALRRLLLVNVGLDVFYVVAGVVVLLTFDTPFAHGNGVGVLIQGGFLLLFDAFYATRVKIN